MNLDNLVENMKSLLNEKHGAAGTAHTFSPPNPNSSTGEATRKRKFENDHEKMDSRAHSRKPYQADKSFGAHRMNFDNIHRAGQHFREGRRRNSLDRNSSQPGVRGNHNWRTSDNTAKYNWRSNKESLHSEASHEDRKQNQLHQSETDRTLNLENYRRKKPTYVISDGSKKLEGKKPGVRYTGFKYLKELSEKEAPEITCVILNPDSPFSAYTEKRDLQADWLFLIMKIVCKVCLSKFIGLRNEMLNQICRSEFLHAVSYYLGEISVETRKSAIEKLPSFVGDLIQFYSSIIDYLPSVALDKDIAKLIAKTKKAIDSMNTDHNLNIDENLVGRLNTLNDKIEDCKKLLERSPKVKNERSYLQFMSEQPPPDSFRELDLYPTYEDLTRQCFGFVRPNKIKGAYDDVEHYLDIQFRLLREDFIDPLRRGLNQYLDAKSAASLGGGKIRLKFKYESLRLYPNCVFEEVRTEKSQLAFLLNFDPKQKMRIKWEYSKRFMYGSLLLFTNDDFKTFFYGTVSNRDMKLLTAGKILISFPSDVQADKNFLSKEFLMAESEVFFEPYFLVMKLLKSLNAENFPMTKYIVEGKTDEHYPLYMRQELLWNVFEYSVNKFDTASWPSNIELGLDAQQHHAFVKALTSEFCVIQGPPGTGKTFIGLKIVQVLLKNIKLNENRIRSPLLIVCYTNHALDQFLEGILKYTKKIIRVGSQSKSDLLKDFNLRGRNQLCIRRSTAAKNQLGPAMLKIRSEVINNWNAIARLTEQKKRLEKPEGILKYDIVRNAMTEDQRNMLPDSKSLLDWLLEYENENYLASSIHQRKNFNDEDEKLNEDPDGGGEDTGTKEEEEYGEDSQHHLIDEDDVFEMDSATKDSLSSDSPYEVTVEQERTKYRESFERLHWLKRLPDEEIEDLAAYYNEQQSLDVEIIFLARKLEILEEQLTNPNCAVEKIRCVLTRDACLLSLPDRWVLYWSWIRVLRENVIQELQEVEVKYRSSLSKYEDVKQMEDLYVVQKADVVGMTTTCAARLHSLLNALKPAIVVVEEAAEVLETHIVTSLTKSCQQVILIGDHKQLRPSSAVYKLSMDYNIDVSLFERMINNGMDCPMLNVQHRMRPEISSLITPLIYADLKNDLEVFTFENIKGITKNLFFLEHNCHEQDVADTNSRQNAFEADFLIELCRYLILQGYDPEKITMLTTYAGQMFLLREKKRHRQLTQHVKCIVVDKYQGEENDIILLSLVRSNKEAKIGFLKTENRVCVALSRARKGFYIVGNMDNLAKSSPNLWGNIRENLRKQNAIGKEMRLFCSRHQVNTDVSCAKDFDKVSEGGCSHRCGELLACGHNCKSLCHTLDREHLQKPCREPCERMCDRETHTCKKLCFEDCGRCEETMTWKLRCDHTKKLPCHIDESQYMCDTIVDDVSPLCKHAVKRKCHEKPEDVACPSPCEDRLECGHACTQNCHKKRDPDHLKFQCQKPCGKTNKMCSREHKCLKLCFEKCGLCSIPVSFTLKCGHKIKLSCSTDIDRIACFKNCEKICPDCKMRCMKKCHENCAPCQNKVVKQITECGHAARIKCHVRPERKDCIKDCERLLGCGHKCVAKCRAKCGAVACAELVKVNGVRGLCGHDFVITVCSQIAEPFDEERLRNVLQYCDAPCNTLLKCGDPCNSTCSKCWQGRLHEQCQRNCGSVGICGHSCKYPCRQMCPPCEEPCGYRCRHSKCPKKCGVPCVQCKEPCEWTCPHKYCTKKCGEICDREPCYEACPRIIEKCGHPCIGFCGEPCPPECRECNKEITEIMFGFEDEENARFVYLVDCKHTIESKALDIHLNTASKGGEIVMKLCPLCKTPITQTLRYMNSVKKTYSDILKVKAKIFGTKKTLTEKRKQLFEIILQFDREAMINIRVTGLYKMRKIIDQYFRGKVDIVKNKRNIISNAELKTIDFVCKVFNDLNSRLENLCEGVTNRTLRADAFTQTIIKYVNALLDRMREPGIQISEQLAEDIALELSRYHKMVDFSLVLRNPLYLNMNKNDVTVNEELKKLENHIFGVERFDRVEHEVNKGFEALQKILESASRLSAVEEKKMVYLAMSKEIHGTGHWFTCSNGHYYVIGECGGAMQTSECPECGEVIGGRNHALVATSRLASDMDGARAPAWGAGNDMGNYHFI